MTSVHLKIDFITLGFVIKYTFKLVIFMTQNNRQTLNFQILFFDRKISFSSV